MDPQIPEHYELYIGFVGLTAFVPRTEELVNGGEVVTRATAILPRVVEGDPHAGYRTATGKQLLTHDAKLKLIVGGVQGDVLPTDYTVKDKAIRKALSLADIHPREWSIDRRVITFDTPTPSPAVTTVLRTLRGHGDPFPFDRLELSDTTWLSSIREIFDGAEGTQTTTKPKAAGKVDPGCLTGKAPRVAARIELPRGGCLASLGLVEHRKKILRYGYRCLHPDTTCTVKVDRAISQNVVLRLPIHDPERRGVVMKSELLDDDTYWEVTLTPRDLFGRFKIILVVDHQPATAGHHTHEPAAAVEHFEVFYELSKSKPDMKDRPVPQASSKKGRRSLGVILPGTGELDSLSRKLTWIPRGRSMAAKIKLAKAVVGALKKDTGQICPNSMFEPEKFA